MTTDFYCNSFDFKGNGGSRVYEYDGNGSLSVDPYKGFAFEYDLLDNLKRTESEYTTSYVYSSTGERLSVESKFNGCIAKPHHFFFSDWEEDGVVFNSTSDDSGDSDIMDRWSKMMYPRDTEFCGPFIFEYSVLNKFLFDGGYCTFKDGQASFHYYLQDHLGNNRAVVSEAGTVEQTTEYYPFGGIYGDVSTNSGLQLYKYNGKEFDHSLGLDLYDYGARLYDPALVVWTGVDPLADEYGGISPYVYCGDNPVVRYDPDGMDWYRDKDKTWQYSPNVHSQKDLTKGQIYKGKSFFTGKGINLVQYRSDGSILYTNETAAYNRMWDQANRHYRTSHEKEGREVGGFILSNGKVLVLPDYKNDENTFKIEEYDYITTKNGFLTRKQEKYHIKGMIHSHQSKNFGAKPSYEDYYVSKRMGGLPVITIGWDAKVHGMFASGKYYNIINWNINRKDLFSGKIKLYNYINQ